MALQELSGAEARLLRLAHPGTSVFSHEEHGPATWAWMGCGLLLKEGIDVLEKGVVDALPKPQRSLWARIRQPGRDVMTVVSWHAPNAASDGRDVKMAAYRSMSEWLAGQDTAVVLGADLNTWSDLAELKRAVKSDPFFEENEFVGPEAGHGLVDAYRQVLSVTGRLAVMSSERPTGPLATSHVLQGGAEHRMDRVFCSSSSTPLDAAYESEAALEAGSDHALHWVDFA